MTYDFSDVLLVNFPFSSYLGKKKRPAVVISTPDFNKENSDLVLLAITSKIDNLRFGESFVKDWKQSGLVKPSAFKSVVFTVEKDFIDKKLGTLSAEDRVTLLGSLRKILSV